MIRDAMRVAETIDSGTQSHSSSQMNTSNGFGSESVPLYAPFGATARSGPGTQSTPEELMRRPAWGLGTNQVIFWFI